MNKKKEILWISISIPYDEVDHAGGKTHNFYLKKVHAVEDFYVKLISFCEKKDFGKSDLEHYQIDADICYLDKNVLSIVARKLWNVESTLNPFTKYANAISNYRVYECLKRIRKLYKKGYIPDVVILQWTSLVLLQKEIKRYFPDSRIIAIEEDVMFQNYERRYQIEKSKSSKWFYMVRAQNLRKRELLSLEMANLIFVNNRKDFDLLTQNHIAKTKIKMMVPYYEQFFDLKRVSNLESKDILFYGAMSRRENYLSAIWFIENVFIKIKDKSIRFIIVGSNPDESLKQFQSKRILVTGFVDDVSLYFAKCMCLVVPLLYGAGIKVKILEGFSAGIPILTNSIGIEGIGGRAGQEYYHCESPQEYIDTIEKISGDMGGAEQIGKNGRQFVKESFNYNLYMETMIDALREI